MKRIFNILFIAILFMSAKAAAQDYLFFNDSPISTYYDPSWGFSNNSVVVLTSGKVPVDSDTRYSGMNSLRVRWKSVQGGDWGISIAEAGLKPHDITKKDSLTFSIFSFADVDTSGLPVVYLEDISGKKTARKRLSAIIPKLNKSIWEKISVPINVFISSPDSADVANIRAVCFGQGSADNTLRTLYIDEIRMTSAKDYDSIPPSAPIGISVKSDSTHMALSWQPNKESDLAGYRIYRKDVGNFKVIANAAKSDSAFVDFTGIPPKTFTYSVSAYDISGNESALSKEITASTISLSDSALLDMTERATFKYFWDYGHPVSGLARDRLGGGDIVTIGGSGFGVMAILVGVERGFITRDAAVERMLTILNFLAYSADQFHGIFPHWLNGQTGRVIPFSPKDDGGDLVETAFMIQGLLAARQYFNRATANEDRIRKLITSIWESVEWDWYRKDTNSNFLYWHWSPKYNWDMNFRLQGWNETMICYLLAIASPTHPIPASMYDLGWASSPNYRNGKSYYGIPLYVGGDYGGPLFFAHYSFLGFDPRNKKDKYANYFINNRNHALIHQAYCQANPKNFPGYDADTWGLTASDDPFGYLAHEPNNDNGTISPTAAISSMPYTPKESMNALKSFYYEYGKNLWGEYGFKDAFNLKQNWFAQSYLAIDQGPIIVMIENYRTQLLWKYFMADPAIKPMLDKIGFVPDSTTVGVKENADIRKKINFELFGNYPNPFNPGTTIKFSLPDEQKVILMIYDTLGRNIKTLLNDRVNRGANNIYWDGTDNSGRQVSSGVYIYTISIPGKTASGKMILQK